MFNETILKLLQAHEIAALFLGSFLIGEIIIIPAAFLAAQGIISLTNIFLMGFFGTILFDHVCLFISRFFFIKSPRFRKYQEKHQELFAITELITGKHPFFILFYNKFLQGTRIISIMLLSLRKISLKKFLIFDISGTILWLAVTMTVGWFAGKGISNITSITYKIESGLTILFVLFISLRIVKSKIKHKALNRHKMRIEDK